MDLQRNELAVKVKTVTTATVVRAESVDDELPITIAHAAAIRSFLEAAGIEFVADDDGAIGVRLRKSI